MQEKRQYHRFSIEGSIEIQTNTQPPHHISGKLIDLSAKGMAVRVPEKIVFGLDVKFELKIEIENQPICGEGTVIYALEKQDDSGMYYRMGIHFTKIDSKTIQNILNRI